MNTMNEGIKARLYDEEAADSTDSEIQIVKQISMELKKKTTIPNMNIE